ncbi:hypothetical protein UFOVP3_34 [uncultured Caudovirales phage]|uniref:Uncharacterized protein n=1 Tax=uncultured Caudovirales phage TaxID=2100421 RepID=A0A6J5T7B6_9CAUD|nr:hypothetical protein UFOVP3_34 [uncultured Caudovirales phage]
MNKAEIKNSIITNIIVVDPNNIPDWCADWPEATELCDIGGSYVDGVFIPKPQPTPEPPPLEQQQAARALAYKNEADPIFFKAQRGEATQQEWLDKIEEIKLRYPYPEVIA